MIDNTLVSNIHMYNGISKDCPKRKILDDNGKNNDQTDPKWGIIFILLVTSNTT